MTIDKISGKVAYAVPDAWPNLKYDTRLGGYRVDVTEDQIKGAPKFNRNRLGLVKSRSRSQRLRLL